MVRVSIRTNWVVNFALPASNLHSSQSVAGGMLSVPAEIADSDQLSAVDVLLNESIKLHCAADGLPRPRVAWYLDDARLRARDNASDGTHLLDDGRTLYVERARLSHAGRYACRADNVVGQDEKLIDLTVLGQLLIHLMAARSVYRFIDAAKTLTLHYITLH